MSAITTELQLRVSGVAEAVRGLNEVSNASKTMNTSFSGAGRFGTSQARNLARSFGGEAGSMIGGPLGGVLQGASFGGPAGAAAAGGLAVLGIAIRGEAKLLEEHNQRLQDAAYKSQNYWQMITGAKVEDDPSALKKMLRERLSTVASIVAEWREEQAAAAGNASMDTFAKQLLQDNPDMVRGGRDFENAVRAEAIKRDMQSEQEAGIAAQQKAEADTRERARKYNEHFEKKALAEEEERKRVGLSAMGAMSGDLQRGNRMREQAMGMAQQDFQRGPQYAGITLAGSHEARLDAARTEWEKSFDLQETANDYLRQLVDKASQTIIYGIN
jgi:hypothetical protein